MKIGVVAVSSRFAKERGEAIQAWFDLQFPLGEVTVAFHPNSFDKSGHFAGDDAARADAFVEFANDPRLDHIWFARGGYGSCRIAEAVMRRLTDVAKAKRYLGYSDVGSMLAILYENGFEVAHGPMASDGVRNDATGFRSLNWLRKGETEGLEPSLLTDPRPAVAFNLTVLDQLLGTPLEPDLTGHVLMLEDVSEAAYRIDRMMFHLTSQPSIRCVAGIRAGWLDSVVEVQTRGGLLRIEWAGGQSPVLMTGP
eukprot:gene47994-64398_t